MRGERVIDLLDLVTGRYFDSVRLMQVSQSIGDMDRIHTSLVAMATDLNLELLADMGFDVEAVAGAGPDDLLIAVRADDQEVADRARTTIDRMLSSRSDTGGAFFSPPAPHTVESAARLIGANLAVISVPGPHAFVEAMAALEAGLHVMVFSDNVPIAHERALKTAAVERGLLVMGPDCGTAIVNGVGLGFANAVEPGPVAITGASGTGIQQLCCLLDAAGVGVTHALGTGSRDLTAEIGAASTLQSLAALDADPDTSVIVLVSKPPDPGVAQAVEDAVVASRTPVVSALLGSAGVTLESAARQTLEILGRQWPGPSVWCADSSEGRSGVLRGLFSGGTLRAEAHAIAEAKLGPIGVEPGTSGHWLCDFGDDRYTRGRAHPMIDPTLRLEALEAVTGDAETGVVILDVVLGYGADPDPASGIVPLVEAARNTEIPVIVSLCGSRGDPQGRDDQALRLMESGAEVYLSNAAAARRAVELAEEAGNG
jgi:FdrA protein